MTNFRYGFSFILSSIIFAMIGFSFLLFAQKVEKPKKPKKTIIKIAIITPPTPIIKKTIEKKIIKKEIVVPPKVVVPLPIPKKKIIKKKIVKKKKIIKKKIIKKIIKKKRLKKRIVKKKIIKKRVPKKKIIKKKIIKKKVVRKKVVKKKITKQKKFVEKKIFKEVYIPIQQPIIKKVIHKAVKKSPKVRQVVKVNNSQQKKAFLNRLRSKIIANKKYPRMALRRRIQGNVSVKFDITASGTVSNIRFISGKSILQKSVKNAIQQSFPISIPSVLKSELPIKNISVTIHFNIH